VIRPFGERALLVELDGPDAAQRLDAELRRTPVAGVIGTVPGLASLLVELDPVGADPASVAREVEARLVRPLDGPAVAGHRRVVPVVFGGEHGPDLGEAAALAGMTEDEMTSVLAAVDLRVLFDGFAPGFAYLGVLPERLRVPRLATPRTRTPPGSVAIAGEMAGIYPSALPGGWRVVGRTPIELFDPTRTEPAFLAPGDLVRFEPIEAVAWGDHAGPRDDW
jgi:KipI family sensor histidine kinase inhibitor